jgi:hypothetical protein
MIVGTAFKIKDGYNGPYCRSISILMWSAVAYSFGGIISHRSTKMASSDWAVAGSLPGDGPINEAAAMAILLMYIEGFLAQKRRLYSS